MFKTTRRALTRYLTLLLSREPERISAQTLYRQKLESLPKICAADPQYVSIFMSFMQLFFESCTVEASQTGAQTEFNAK